ncbi:MAG: hypothetical protein KIS92_17580 [Planctomycetota bacterium]|nr:hypothetical protein [Planctomycetota bacterium]
MPTTFRFAILGMLAALPAAPSLLAAEAPPGNSALAQAAAGLAPGAWKEVKTEGLTKELMTTSKGYAIVTWGDDGAWDPKRAQFLFMGFRQELKFVRYDERSNAWEATPPYESKVVFGHPYGTNALNAEDGVFYNLENGTNQVHAFDLNKKTWSKLPPCPFQCLGLGLAIEYFPDMKALVFLYQRSAFKFDLAQQKWSVIAKDLPIGSAHVMCHYNAKHKCLYMLGGNDRDTAVAVMDAQGQVTAKKDAPIKIGMNTGYAAAIPDPATGDVLVFSAKDDFYAWDPDADTWTKLGNAAKDTPIKSVGVIAAPIEAYGVTFWVDAGGSDKRVWIYRHKKEASK